MGKHSATKENEIRLKNKRICLKLIKFLQKLDGNKIIGEKVEISQKALI